MEKPKAYLQDWYVVGEINPYRPPDEQPIQLVGKVSGHSRKSDGEEIRTSRIVNVSGRFVETINTIYELGEPQADYVRWCKENNKHLLVGDNPIEILSRGC